MDYFANSYSLEDIKRTYTKLINKNNPNLGGDINTYKDIVKQYNQAINDLFYYSSIDESDNIIMFYHIFNGEHIAKDQAYQDIFNFNPNQVNKTIQEYNKNNNYIPNDLIIEDKPKNFDFVIPLLFSVIICIWIYAVVCIIQGFAAFFKVFHI